MRMNRIGKALLSQTELLSIEELVSRIDAVTSDDVQRLADEFWRPDGMSAAAIGPDRDVIRSAVERLSPALVS
jgi:predicted Zn-dependent peptidase